MRNWQSAPAGREQQSLGYRRGAQTSQELLNLFTGGYGSPPATEKTPLGAPEPGNLFPQP